MRVKTAAGTAFVFVLIHLIIHVIVNLIYLGTMMSHLSGSSVVYLLSSTMSLAAGVLLDVGLLMVCGSLARSKEQLMRDEPEY